MKYIALLRGIGPGNPNMTNDKLRGVFESLGFSEVRTVISSGNIIFTATEKPGAKLEQKIQDALRVQLGITGGTIIRSEDELRAFLRTNPFAGYSHSRTSYLTVTFLKDRRVVPRMHFPFDRGNGSRLLSFDLPISAVCAVNDATHAKTSALMVWLEKQFSKDITTRTWKTVERIATKL